MKILFIDDRMNEVARQWEQSGCASSHELLSLQPFASIEQTCHVVACLQPDVIVVGFGLGVPGITGADVIAALCEQGYSGKVFANSGGGLESFVRAGVSIDAGVNRNSHALRRALDEGA